MNAPTCRIIIAVIATAGSIACGGQGLRLYLPRTVTIEQDRMRLSHLGVLQGDDPQLLAKAAAITMGRSPFPRETMVITRTTVLSRLAASGIGADAVSISGAEEIAVHRSGKTVSAAEIIGAAREYLRRNHPRSDESTWQLCGKSEDLLIAAAENVKLSVLPGPKAPSGIVKVLVLASAGKRKLGQKELAFKLIHPAKRAVALKNIPAGGKITDENTRVETVMVDRPVRKLWVSPFGKITTGPISHGAVVRQALLKAPRSASVVKRNQAVLMKIRGVRFTVTGLGQALQDGRVGDYIKVRNMDSKRIVMARVSADGTVRPIFNEVTK